METAFPLFFAVIVGFTHAFEADHIAAVGNIVTKRDKLTLAVKDGIYWGVGHASTIIFIGLLIIAGKATFLNNYFSYFEVTVGAMLVVLGLYRIARFFKKDETQGIDAIRSDSHREALGVGLIHGLAGSGAMVLLVMTEMHGSINSILYLLIFGIGSITGMLVAAGVMSLPFSKKMHAHPYIQGGLVFLSCALCIVYGSYIFICNLS